MSLINREALIAEYDRVHIGHPGGARKLMVDAPEVKPEPKWIPVSDKLPEPLKAVIITWKNHEPQFYYSDIKNKPFTGVGIYYKDKWWWWSAYAEDMLAEYGDSKADRMDKAIEVIAWIPLPEPYRAERRTDE